MRSRRGCVRWSHPLALALPLWLAIAPLAHGEPAPEDKATDALLEQASESDDPPQPAPPPTPPPRSAPPATAVSAPTSTAAARLRTPATRPPASDPPSAAQRSQAAPDPDVAVTPPRRTPRNDLDHTGQGSLALAAGWGFSAIAPYTAGVFCGEFSGDAGSDTGRKALCTQAAPWFLELTGGYGVHPRVEVLLGIRLAVQRREFRCKDASDPESCKGLFNRSLAVGLTPGVRAWFSRPERLAKIGGQLDFVWLHESFAGFRAREACRGPDDGAGGPCPFAEADRGDAEAKVGDNDVGLRIGPVVEIDPHRNVGIILQPTARMGFARWFEFAFEVSLGVQARFP